MNAWREERRQTDLTEPNREAQPKGDESWGGGCEIKESQMSVDRTGTHVRLSIQDKKRYDYTRKNAEGGKKKNKWKQGQDQSGFESLHKILREVRMPMQMQMQMPRGACV